MDKRKSVLNVTVSIVFRVLLFISAIITRRMLIQYIGNEANGINSLYISIIGVLSVAELGVGSSISFSMYKPIVSGDVKKVTALYCLYKRLYGIISVVILIGGFLILPFLPTLAGGYSSEKIFLYKTFLLSLCAVLMTYMYSAKSSLINAYKNNYITTTITSAGDLVINALQVFAIVYTRSFELYLLCRIIGTALQWIATSLVANKNYREITIGHESLDDDTKKEVSSNVKAMFI